MAPTAAQQVLQCLFNVRLIRNVATVSGAMLACASLELAKFVSPANLIMIALIIKYVRVPFAPMQAMPLGCLTTEHVGVT